MSDVTRPNLELHFQKYIPNAVRNEETPKKDHLKPAWIAKLNQTSIVFLVKLVDQAFWLRSLSGLYAKLQNTAYAVDHIC